MPRLKVVSFRISKADKALIPGIVARAIPLTKVDRYNAMEKEVGARIKEVEARRLNLSMDLCATHANGCPLDFQILAGFDDFNFFHDIDGVSSRLDRETGKLTRFFVPRCAKHTASEARRANAQKRAAKGRR